MDTSHLFDINVKDVTKAVAIVVIGAFLGALQQAFAAHGIDVMGYDWLNILQFSLGAGATYLVKNFLSDKDGKVFGAIG